MVLCLEISFHSEFEIEFRDCPEPKTKIISDFFFLRRFFSNTSLVGFFCILNWKSNKRYFKAQENLKFLKIPLVGSITVQKKLDS